MALVLILAGQAAAADTTIYDRLGGREKIAAVVDDVVARVGADPLLKPRFAGSDMAAVKKSMTDQICQLAGGPCEYAGRDMKTAHAGMGITSAEFQAFMGHMMAALEKAGVPSGDRGALAGKLFSMKPDIVEKP